LAPSLFLPLLSLFALTYPVTAFLRIRQNFTDRLARFDLLVPTLNVCWAFILARYVLFAMGAGTILVGIVGVIAALSHLGLAWWLVKDKKSGAAGANAFVFAGTVLLAMALPAATTSILASLPFLAAVSCGLAILAEKWKNDAVRLTSYLLQIYSALALAFLLLTAAPDAHGVGATLSAAILACLGLIHYKWCRSHLPPANSAFFLKLDKHDLSAAVLLLVSLLSAFFMLRIVVHQFLGLSLPAAGLDSAFRSAQSVIINVSAAILMLFALAHQKKEVRNIAILITVIGAIKVFLYDLIGGMHGLPLVISIFSFGISTALESFGLTRWHHFAPPETPGAIVGGNEA
jgi:hypothetical protein